MIADQFSRTREQEEVLEFHQFADAAVQVHSESGREYVLTTESNGRGRRRVLLPGLPAPTPRMPAHGGLQPVRRRTPHGGTV